MALDESRVVLLGLFPEVEGQLVGRILGEQRLESLQGFLVVALVECRLTLLEEGFEITNGHIDIGKLLDVRPKLKTQLIQDL